MYFKWIIQKVHILYLTVNHNVNSETKAFKSGHYIEV